jgi:3-oxoadipate enol-lactonase
MVPVMLAYDVTGTGPAVVLLHSTVCDRRMWDPQWPVLAEAGYRVMRCDFRGFGSTPVPQGPYSDADDVLDVADELGLGPIALVGSSYGGKVALEIAARQPERVTALALLCSAMPGHEPSEVLRAFWRQEEELIEAGDIGGAVELNVATWLGPEADEPVREKVRQMQRHALAVQLAAPEEFEPVEVAVDLHAITAPSLVVAGAKDLPDFRQIAAELADLLPAARPPAARSPAGGLAAGRLPADRLTAGRRAGGRVVELAWAGHLPTLERPEELSAMLVAFLREAVRPAI